MHVGDLDGASAVRQNTWAATVTIIVHDGGHRPVANAAVDGSWNDSNAASCATDAGGGVLGNQARNLEESRRASASQ
jgi:hypothetical protein